jgi:hypothetical protein
MKKTIEKKEIKSFFTDEEIYNLTMLGFTGKKKWRVKVETDMNKKKNL